VIQKRRDVRRVHLFALDPRPEDLISSDASGSDKRNASVLSSDTSGSDNPHPFRDVSSSVLVDALIAARAARGNRKAMRRPQQPRAMSDSSIYARTRSHLRKLAWRALNDRVKAGHDAPPVDALTDALAAYVLQECPHIVLDFAPGDPRPSSRQTHARLTLEAVQRVTAGAARYVLERWTPDYIREQQRRGAAGGSASSRGPTWTPEALDSLAALMAAEPHLTREQLADRMGLCLSMIKRMRSALRSLNS